MRLWQDAVVEAVDADGAEAWFGGEQRGEPFAYRLRAGRWTTFPLPIPRNDHHTPIVRIGGVAANGAGRAALVGFGVFSDDFVRFADVWNGTRWSLEPIMPTVLGLDELYDVELGADGTGRAVGATWERSGPGGSLMPSALVAVRRANRWRPIHPLRSEIGYDPRRFPRRGSVLSGVEVFADGRVWAVGATWARPANEDELTTRPLLLEGSCS
ncbi:MAG TPA: hypothetical protein VLB86_04895 [Gaiellaceae bacterium]|nr:hypothetical protein [Gaiellaceae bacterium]